MFGKYNIKLKYSGGFRYDMQKKSAVVLALEPAPSGSEISQSIFEDKKKELQVIPAFTSVKSKTL